MSLYPLHTLDIIEAMENFIARRRPPLEVRDKLDIAYKTEDQSVIIFEIRPAWNNPTIVREHPIAKATYVKTQSCWKVFWMRADLKWHSYSIVNSIQEFVAAVDKDEHGCFWG